MRVQKFQEQNTFLKFTFWSSPMSCLWLTLFSWTIRVGKQVFFFCQTSHHLAYTELLKCEHADPYNIKSILPSLYWSHVLWLQMSKPFDVSTPPLISWAFVEILWIWRGIYKALRRTYWVQKEFKLSAVAVLCYIKFTTKCSKLIHFF
jgi:hypothetical protein